LLIGHVDVVPASRHNGWWADPFDPVIRDSRMYGRGAGDMKAGVVAMIYAIVALRKLGYVPGGGGLMICTVVEEECTGNGALAYISNNDDGMVGGWCTMGAGDTTTRMAVIIPEPFPWIVTAQLGVLWFMASVTGRPCHVLSNQRRVD
jgi:acetylornithine deacetylase